MQHQPGVDLAARQGLELHVAGRLDQFQRDLRTQRAEVAHPQRQLLEADGGDEGQAHAADLPGRRRACPRRQRLGAREQVAHVRQQRLAGRRQCHPTLRAVEQPHLQHPLQLGDGLRHGWLGQVQPPGRAAEVQFLGDGDELAPGPQVDRKVFHTPSISIGH